MNRFKFHLTDGCERTAEVRSNTFLDKNTLEYLISNALIMGKKLLAKMLRNENSQLFLSLFISLLGTEVHLSFIVLE